MHTTIPLGVFGERSVDSAYDDIFRCFGRHSASCFPVSIAQELGDALYGQGQLFSNCDTAGKTIDHSVILKVVTTNICGSDQHMVRGRTTAPGMVLGHEITGEVIEMGRDVEHLEIGDLVSVPFKVACGRCRTCREVDAGVGLHVNSDRAGDAYGYLDMGGWIGGQADYVMMPYTDFNLLKSGQDAGDAKDP